MRHATRFAGVIFLLLMLAACSPTPIFTDYYVSVLGSDSSGTGTQSKPWRHIQYALDHANYSAIADTVRIHLAKGIYNENIVIDEDVMIIGVGTSEVVSTQAGTQDLPNQTVSIISRQNGKVSAGAQIDAPVTVKNGAEAILQDLNIYGGNVTVTDSDFSLQNVLVNGVTGFYGIKVSHSSFSILNSWIRIQPTYHSDYGLYAVASSGFFTNSYVGNLFDHAINIEPLDTEQNINVYDLPLSVNIYITNATVEGSAIYYADGIRIQGPANVIIKNSNIKRTGGEAANSGGEHNRPYAAIEVAGYIVGDNKMRRVEIYGTSMSGFDVGIGVDISTLELKVEGNNIDAISNDVETSFVAYTGTTAPTVDFGGGPLGSKGNNTFSNKPQYAYDHDTGTYPVFACHNNWMVATNSIDSSRIYDKLDKATLGRVQWDCSGANSGSNQQGLTVVTPTHTQVPVVIELASIPKQNVNCRLGNSASLFDIVDTLYKDERYSPIGIGPDRQWVAFVGPVYGARCWVYIGSLTFVLNNQPTDPGEIPETYLPYLRYPPQLIATFTPEALKPAPTRTTTLIVPE